MRGADGTGPWSGVPGAPGRASATGPRSGLHSRRPGEGTPDNCLSRRALIGGGAAAAVGLAATALQIRAGSGFVPPDPEAGPLYTRCSFGAYADNSPYPDLRAYEALEGLVGVPLGEMAWFQDFGAPWLDRQAEAAAATGHDLCIAWQPTADGSPIAFQELIDGGFDTRLIDFFRAAARFPGRVLLRPFWEMNASAGRYSLNYHGSDRQVGSIDEFHAAWRHLVQVQRQETGDRVEWFFCANGDDVGPFVMEDYWPGEEWVDRVGFDTYNDDWSPWAPFEEKVGPMYERLRRLAPDRPVALGEMGCKEDGAPGGVSKATWLAAMFESTEFARLEHISFFHADKSIDWRMNSSPEALEVHRHYLRLAAQQGG